MSLFVVGTDATIVNIALPSIQHSFRTGVGRLQWTVDAYTLVAQAGVAAAIASTSRHVGAVLGVAVAGSLAAGGSAASFVTASHAAWLVIAACGLWIIGMGVLTTSRWARRSATRTRELLIKPPEINHDVTARAA